MRMYKLQRVVTSKVFIISTLIVCSIIVSIIHDMKVEKELDNWKLVDN